MVFVKMTFLIFSSLPGIAGVYAMTIKDQGGWESIEIVQRYTRPVTTQDILKFYKAPPGEVSPA